MANLLSKSIRPALTHATSLGGLEAAAGTTAGHAVGQTVSVLVCDDVVLESTVTLGVGEVPQEHAHRAALAVGRGGEVRVVDARRRLDGDGDTIIAPTTVAEVVVLEVERGLREAVAVVDVVHGVDNVECVRARRVDVRARRGGRREVDGVVEDEIGARLGCYRALAAPESDRVVACGCGRRSSSVAVPAFGRGGGVKRVSERLKALCGDFPLDGEDEVLRNVR